MGLKAHFARLGGVLVAPQRSLAELLWGPHGSVWELLPWMAVVTAAIAPTETGRALLIARVNILDGVRLFLTAVSQRMIFVIVGAIAGAFLLMTVDFFRRSEGRPRLTWDRAMDACAFAAVPFLVFASLGAILSLIGLELWFMPHRLLRGRGWHFALRFVMAYGWSLALYLLLARQVWIGDSASDSSEAR